jgi:hypothetical protein
MTADEFTPYSHDYPALEARIDPADAQSHRLFELGTHACTCCGSIEYEHIDFATCPSGKKLFDTIIGNIQLQPVLTAHEGFAA